MDSLPEVKKCCNCIPMKVGQCCIAFVALTTGGSGIALVVLLALFEEDVAVVFGRLAENIKWPVIGGIALFSTVLTLSGCMFCIAPCMKASHATVLKFGFLLVMIMCGTILFITISPTLACVLAWFYLVDSRICMVDFMSVEVLLLSGLIIYVFVSAWCYYAIAIGNYVNKLGGH